MTPRMKFILGMILLPSMLYLLGSATAPSPPFDFDEPYPAISSNKGGKPSFHPHAEETEGGYGLHLVEEELDIGYGSSRWGLGGLGRLGLDKLTGKQKPLILVTGGAGQLGESACSIVCEDGPSDVRRSSNHTSPITALHRSCPGHCTETLNLAIPGRGIPSRIGPSTLDRPPNASLNQCFRGDPALCGGIPRRVVCVKGG